MATKQTKGPGRPEKEIDYALVARYAQAQCTQEMIAATLHLSLSRCTHDAEFLRVYAEAREEGKQALLYMQYQTAMKGNVPMQIWLGKQHLKQSDKVESKNEDHVTIVIGGDDKDV